MKLLSVSAPDTRRLYNVHVMPFFELRFLLTAVSMIAYFAAEFADGKPQPRTMLVHAFSPGTEIN